MIGPPEDLTEAPDPCVNQFNAEIGIGWKATDGG